MAAKKKTKRRSILPKVILVVFLLLLCIGGGLAYRYYSMIYSPNVVLENPESPWFYINTGSEFEDVVNGLYESGFITNRSSFEWVAERKHYPTQVKPGRYRLQAGMNNDALVNLLRSGEQEPINIVFNNLRTLNDLAARVGKQIEADSAQLAAKLNDPEVVAHYGFTAETFPAMFVPNTYEVYWNTSADQFLARMAREFKAFWTDERVVKANAIGLSQSEVVTLASIVKAETNMKEDMPRIAGVYINRIKKGIPLQADPTLIFGIGDYSIRRVLDVHKEVDSPYNTYKYKGLPPGPINFPATVYVDAVLNYERNNYIYFCAREDFSGYSNFAATYREHLLNARKWQQALNKRKIYK